MNKKSLIIIIMCMVGVLFTALSVSAASDAADNMTVGSEDQTVIEAQSIQEDVLRDTPGNFEDLNTTIYDTSIPEGGTVSLSRITHTLTAITSQTGSPSTGKSL